MTTPAVVLAWNVNNGDRATFPNELDALPQAVVYAFNEVGGHAADLDHWADANRLLAATNPAKVDGPRDVVRNSQLYVDPARVKIIRVGVEVVDVTWRGPGGKPIAGRSIVWALVEVDGVPLLVVLVHAPWSPVRNPRAWRAYQRKVRQIGTWFPYADMLLVGDQNQTWAVKTAWAIRTTANKIGARLVKTGASIDFGLFRAGRFKRWTVTARKGLRLRSDHFYTVYRLVKR